MSKETEPSYECVCGRINLISCLRELTFKKCLCQMECEKSTSKGMNDCDGDRLVSCRKCRHLRTSQTDAWYS
jgi:hypothetical protein